MPDKLKKLTKKKRRELIYRYHDVKTWDDSIKFTTGHCLIDHVSYAEWVRDVLPIQIKHKVGEKIDVGDDKYYENQIFPAVHIKYGMFGGFPRWSRSCLETFSGNKRGSISFTDDIIIPILKNKKESFGENTVWMSLTPMEVMSQRQGIRKSKGHTLVGGLGLGWFTRKVLERKKVKKVTVVEKDKTVIDFIGKPLMEEFGNRLNIVHGDVYSFLNEHGLDFDSISMDIWSDACGKSYDDNFCVLSLLHKNTWGWGIGDSDSMSRCKRLLSGKNESFIDKLRIKSLLPIAS